MHIIYIIYILDLCNFLVTDAYMDEMNIKSWHSNILHANKLIYSLVARTNSFHKLTTVRVNSDRYIKVNHTLALK